MNSVLIDVDDAQLDGAVPRAFAVLELLASVPEPARLSAIAQELDLQKSTVHRILATLIDLGYVEQVPETGCYQSSLKLWELGTGPIARHPIKRAATPYVQKLHAITRETVSLTIMAGDQVLYLDKMVSPRPMPFTSRAGSRLPAPLTAGGKAMLSLMPDADDIARRVRERLKDKRLLNLKKLRAELDEAQRSGYATSRFRAGVVSFGAAIVGYAGEPVAALSVSAPTTRINEQKQAGIIEQLLGTCAEIAENMGSH